MQQTHAGTGPPSHLFALTGAHADAYLAEQDLDDDYESRLLTTRYLFETVLAVRDVASGRLCDQADGSEHEESRVQLAERLLVALDHESMRTLRDDRTDTVAAVTLLLDRFDGDILEDYFEADDGPI